MIFYSLPDFSAGWNSSERGGGERKEGENRRRGEEEKRRRGEEGARGRRGKHLNAIMP